MKHEDKNIIRKMECHNICQDQSTEKTVLLSFIGKPTLHELQSINIFIASQAPATIERKSKRTTIPRYEVLCTKRSLSSSLQWEDSLKIIERPHLFKDISIFPKNFPQFGLILKISG